MQEWIATSAFFGLLLTLAAHELGALLSRKIHHPLMNSMLFSIAAIIGVLLLLRVDYSVYNRSAGYLSYLMTPATVCLAVPLYRQIERLRRSWKAIFAGILSGVLTSAACILLVALAFHLTHAQYVTLLPKSITAAIGMPLAGELGGSPTIAMVAIALTGIFGNMFAAPICRLFRITDPVAKGVAIGNASHAFGTVKALEMGEVEGAMSSLSLVVSGLLTVAASSLFAGFL